LDKFLEFYILILKVTQVNAIEPVT